ncbi:S1/P1 nuclease [Fluviispira sanaruensis]|uniref:S1/P1 Nuclease n=1 Tax=Fluviispira sanaruensis TaxID=2493639 RepID=A0A4V0P2N2_FLUSA|nr:S1/P1 nuclease [Fluviispira sanaruensis]BBH53817.1 S1/P1 Nuclease [Fluviispira sanaruensis]
MNRYIKSFSIFLACFALHAQVFAFWDQSHQLVAKVAEKKLNKESLSKVQKLLNVNILYPGNALLSQNTNSIDTAASWADSIKSYYNQPINKTLSLCHYTDIPLKKNDINIDKSDEAIMELLMEELKKVPYNSVSCLKSAIKTLNTPSESDLNKAIALRFVLHIMGDIAQPLHNVSLVDENFEDAGGNKIIFLDKINITNIDGSVNQVNNLHSLWDSSLAVYLQFPYNKSDIKIGKFTDEQKNLNEIYAKNLIEDKELMELALKEISDVDNQNVENWVIESHKLAIKSVYTDLILANDSGEHIANIKTSFVKGWRDYQSQRKMLMQLQILKAGLRLKMLLDAMYAESPNRNVYRQLIEEILNDPEVKALRVN